jgi:hypothetical protein
MQQYVLMDDSKIDQTRDTRIAEAKGETKVKKVQNRDRVIESYF